MTPCTRYTTAFISRFVDNEVSKAEQNAFVTHIKLCTTCAHTENQFRQIKRTADRLLTNQAAAIQTERDPISVPTSQPPGFWTRHLIVKLAVLSTATLLMLFAIAPRTTKHSMESSAIVNSIDTAGSSVMIIDAPDTGHTIIWFSET